MKVDTNASTTTIITTTTTTTTTNTTNNNDDTTINTNIKFIDQISICRQVIFSACASIWRSCV